MPIMYWLALWSTPEPARSRTVPRRPNNHGSYARASALAVALYTGNTAERDELIKIFKGWLGDRASYAGFAPQSDLSWQCNPSAPVPLNPKGCVKDGHNIDGVLTDEQARGGSFSWPPPKEDYVYGGLAGPIVMAELLSRAGYPAWEWQDKALLRAFTWVHEQADFPAGADDTWQPHLVNYHYGTDFPAPTPSRSGKNMGWTDWSHAGRRP